MSDQHPHGQPQYDQYGQPQYAEPAYAQQAKAPQAWGQQYAQPGHPPYAQPGYDQYGQPQYAQPGYDQYGYDQYGQPTHGQQPYGQPYGAAPELAHWGLRAGAFLLDLLVGDAPLIILGGLGAALLANESAFGAVLVGLGYVGMFGVALWNTVFRQGSTGQSIGKGVVGIRLLGERTGRPLGAGMTFVRGLAHVLDQLPFPPFMIGFLWPLWDAKRQTFADKIIGSFVVKG